MLDRKVESRGQISITPSGVEFGDFEGVQRYASMLVRAGCVPRAKEESDQSLLAKATMMILLGRRVGLTPEQAVTSMYVVNSRPVIFGDAPLGLCRQHKDWDESGFDEYWLVGGEIVRGTPSPEAFKVDSTTAVCETLRKGAKQAKVSEFSVGHAKQAGLYGRNGTLYGGYPQRMLMFRARGYQLRDNFGDALKGIGIQELIDPEETEGPAPPPDGRQSLRQARKQPEQEQPESGADAVEQQTPDPSQPVGLPGPKNEQEDLERQEMIRRVKEDLAAAKTNGDLGNIQAGLLKNRDFLGAAFEELAELGKARAAALAAPAAALAAPAAALAAPAAKTSKSRTDW